MVRLLQARFTVDMSERASYDEIGRSYTVTRREDPRIAAAIWAALGDAESVLDVGAGAGAYEPRDREVIALEPSEVMIAQRPDGAAPCPSLPTTCSGWLPAWW